jgi:hypothetical protein
VLRIVFVIVVSSVSPLLSACGDDGGGGLADADAAVLPDGSFPDVGIDFEIAPPDPPEPPALPQLTPCPAGWTESMGADGGPSVCEPWLGAVDCGPQEARFPGEPGCAPIGRACPTRRFAADIPSGALHVDPDAPAGGDGTVSSPFTTIAEALAAASDGDVIALSVGAHAPPGAIDVAVEIRGACVGQTRIACDPPDTTTVAVQIRASGTTIRDLHLTGCRTGFWIAAEDAPDYAIESVLVTNTSRTALAAFGGNGTLSNFVIRDTRGSAADDQDGRGIVVNAGAHVSASRVAVTRAVGFPVWAYGEGALFEVEDIVVRESAPSGMSGFDGAGLLSNMGGRIVARRAVLEDNHRTGANAHYGGTMELEDVVVRRTSVQPGDGAFGMAFIVGEGSSLTIRRAWVEDNPLGGAWVRDEGSTLSIEDLVVLSSSGHPDNGLGGFGIGAYQQGQMTASRIWIEELSGGAVFAIEDGTQFDVSDLTVRNITGFPGTGELGTGVVVGEGATGVVRRASVEDVRSLAYAAVMGTLTLEDVQAHRIHPQDSDMLAACGFCSTEGGTMSLTRALVDEVWGGGVAAGQLELPGAVLTGSDIRISNVHDAEDIAAGISNSNATLQLSRVWIEDATVAGVIGTGTDAQLDLSDLVVLGVRGQSSDGAYGYGLSLDDGISARLTRTLVSDAQTTGAIVIGADLELDTAVIRAPRANAAGTRARGLEVQGGGHVTAADLTVEDAGDHGIILFEAGTELSGRDVVIRDTMGAPCDPAECNVFGMGVSVLDDAYASLEDFVITRTSLCGVRLARGGTADLRRGEVSYAIIGANVQTEGFDVGRLSMDVRYHHNETNLDAISLPVPQIGARANPFTLPTLDTPIMR